ncbi:helix-turn-helix transcriptional regulator [Thalassococcus sp. S3]|uniref:ArsR/SmtB family transcription factor n=1 Tax=Thalassococcus sp. S3 TaxID=2017482 RepID=UPI0010245730|nr:winged helix-turn-helix domain-containing protein [Thalassococcus sp. S3]QBF33128.1 transcriptional regulator [Thalassococcus sp. S3]
MKSGPDIARIAILIGDPARANILSALMTGHALTASELASEAGVTPQTTSSHLRKLQDGGLIDLRHQGRHRYYSLAGDEVARTLEALMGLAAGKGHLRTRPGPKDAALRHARVCYNHLAGDMGVQMFNALSLQGAFEMTSNDMTLTAEGHTIVTDFGVDLTALSRSRSPLCRECLDWSARRSHLAGKLGRALLTAILDRGWAHRMEGTRVIAFTHSGQTAFDAAFKPG